MKAPNRKTAALLCSIAVALLLYALFGKPPDSYFEFMKFAVLIGASYVAAALYARDERLAPLALCLLALGVFEAFGKLHRLQWQPWNWAMVSAFLVSACALAWSTKSAASATFKDKDSSGMHESTSLELTPHDTSITNEQGTVLTRVIKEAGGRPVIQLSPEGGFTGMMAGTAVIFADTLSKEDKVVFSRWAGLDYKAWGNKHLQAFTAAFLHHAQDAALGRYQAPEVFVNVGRDLKDCLPSLPAPITAEIRRVLDRSVGG